METAVLIAIIAGSAAVLCSLIAAGASIYSVRVSLGNRKVIDQVKIQTNGLLAHAEAEATAKGVTEGHAAGVASGVEAGVKQGLEQAATARKLE